MESGIAQLKPEKAENKVGREQAWIYLAKDKST